MKKSVLKKHTLLAEKIRKICQRYNGRLLVALARAARPGLPVDGAATRQQIAAQQRYKREIRDLSEEFDDDLEEILDEVNAAYSDAQKSYIDETRELEKASGKILLPEKLPNPKDSYFSTTKTDLIAAEMKNRISAAENTILRKANDAYMQAAGRAAMLVTEGKVDYRQATKSAVMELQKKGITGFIDKAGRHWNLTTYCEMAVITAVENATVESYKDTALSFGYDLVEVMPHAGACPLCVPWEGVILSLSGATAGYSTLDEAIGDGLFHPNCLHDIAVYHPGISPKGTTKPLLKAPPTDAYQTRQDQRALERQMRSVDEQIKMARVAGWKDYEREKVAEYNSLKSDMRELISAYNARTPYEQDWLYEKEWRERAY